EHQTGGQADTIVSLAPQRTVVGRDLVGEVDALKLVVGFKETERERLPDFDIHTAAQNRSDAVGGIDTSRRESIESEYGVGEKVHTLGAPGQLRPNREGAISN